ncbi:nicotinate-nucleotide--dimethylbenzimidazole phosphoribosyltransferase [Streptomyces aureus]|uniref:nicotinate-nucleotide--dimethylbenzimidazole phosphoribosyltransferase n=1 Tax=Streptomyces aureus TaxID=193461 RepID=UPI0005643635|nr:nicotinate-nucleotide--dimethylbenzimidazole phosphoribosyltransferase [Streptomyces aureus]
MTDTGQVPGEGLPENAGMVEQPGVSAPGAYTYLDSSEGPVEEDDLLLLPGAPGAQGAWGNEVPPPAPMPFTDEPGPHETDGRDTGAIDLGAVRAPGPSPVAQPVPAPVAAPAAPRRPLHLGPPTPDGSSSPVRSLADRGPAGVRPSSMTTPVAPLRVAGPPTVGPEYLDVPQAAEATPQSAVAWTAVPVAGEIPAEETALPEAGQLPGAPVAPEPVAAPEPVPAAEAPEAVEAEQAPGVVAAPLADEPAAPEAGLELPEADVVSLDLQDPVDAPAPEAVPVTDVSPDQPLPEAPQFQDAPENPGATGAAGEGEQAAAVTPAEQIAEDAGHAVPEQAQAPAGDLAPEDPAVVQLPAPVPGQDTHGAGFQTHDSHGAGLRVHDSHGAGFQAHDSHGAGFQVHDTHGAGLPVQDTHGAGVQVLPQAVLAEPAAQAPEPVVVFVDEPSLPGAERSADAPAPHGYETPESALTALSARSADASHGGQGLVLDEAAAQQFTEAPAHVADGAALPENTAPDQDGAADAIQAVPAVVPAPAEPAHAGPAEGDPHQPAGAEQLPDGAPDQAAAPGFPDAPAVPQADQGLGPVVPGDGTVPAHPAATPPHGTTVAPLPAEEQPEARQPAAPAEAVTADPAETEPVAQVSVPAPREAEPETGSTPLPLAAEHEPVAAQQADDLQTQVADQEESTAVVEDVRESTGPAAPGYNDAEREAVLRVIRERRDIRNGFRSDPIPHDVLLRVLEAAHTAPSVGHSQPWDFVVIRSAETRRSMHELAQRQREAYAQSLPKGRAKQFKEMKIEAILDTPVNVVVTADPTRGGRHTLGRHTQPQMAPYSAALAVENFWLAARAEGLGVGWVSFFDEREMVRALGLPDHLEVVAYLCVGYVDEFPEEPELMQAGWSKRRPLSWVVHEETYGRRALPGEEPHDLLAETVSNIRPLDAKALGEAWERQKRMTKPAGALGMLEIISAQLSGLSRMCPPPIPEPAAVAIFAGDHGVHAQGVTPWPQEVTGQMVANFLGGGAVCNAFANQVGAEVCVVDVGVASDLPATPGLLPRKVRAGTADMTTGPAMTREEAVAALEVGIETARDLMAAGNKALLTGEMGIANTTASAALISVFTGADPAEVTGRGTGINDETLARKTEVVRRAIEFHQPDPADPIGVLAAIGGLEHAAMVGLLLGGASLRTPVILDGVSAGAAALVARAIAPEVLAACIAGHRSAEPGHVAALNKLGLRPLIDLDLRLGEGTGALLALPIVQSAARAMHEVATFDSAGVTEK